ncbi:MFS transporter [Eubacteriales bacterium OttesenSCG-928-K08]|nr:MFS transporter [Eubacteriales bacterium OttesenSCG-928-K08]
MKKTRTRQLLYGLCILLFLGLIYGWSVFVTPLEAEFNWQRAQSSLTFTFSMIFFCLGGFFSGLLLKKFSHRFVLRLSACCLLVGFFFASRVQSLWGIYLSYGVLCGSGVGLGYNCVLGTVGRWFPEKPGFCSGTLMLGFGIGALILGTGASGLIGLIGWRKTFVLLAVVFAAVVAVGAQLIKTPDEQELDELKRRVSRVDAPQVQSLTPKEMFKTSSVWLLVGWGTLLMLVGLAVVGQAVPIALEIGLPLALATTVSGLISVCNGLNRFITGSLFDKLGRTKTMAIITVLFLVATPLLYFATRAKSTALLVAGFLLIGMAYGGVPTLLSAACSRMYGPKNYAINFSFLNFHIIPAAVIGPMVFSLVQQAAGSYTPAFLVLLVGCVAAVPLAALLARQK